MGTRATSEQVTTTRTNEQYRRKSGTEGKRGNCGNRGTGETRDNKGNRGTGGTRKNKRRTVTRGDRGT